MRGPLLVRLGVAAVAVAALTFIVTTTRGVRRPATPLTGFAPASLDAEREAEARLTDALSRARIEADHQFLLKGDVFTEELLRTYIDYKRSKEVDAVRLRPHPYEFALYYDI